jgi:hypothetical protein
MTTNTKYLLIVGGIAIVGYLVYEAGEGAKKGVADAVTTVTSVAGGGLIGGLFLGIPGLLLGAATGYAFSGDQSSSDETGGYNNTGSGYPQSGVTN